jgi:hypothetical protein
MLPTVTNIGGQWHRPWMTIVIMLTWEVIKSIFFLTTVPNIVILQYLPHSKPLISVLATESDVCI